MVGVTIPGQMILESIIKEVKSAMKHDRVQHSPCSLHQHLF